MLTDEERDLLGIENWLKMHHLYMKVSRYLNAKEMGYIDAEVAGKIRKAYKSPGIRKVFGNALMSSKIPKETKKEIAWALMEIDSLESIAEKSKRF